MPYRNHLPDDDGIQISHPVQYCTVLHIALRPNANRVNIPPNDRVHPYTCLLAQNDVANNLCGRINVAACWNYWSYSLIRTNHGTDFTLKRKSDWHVLDFIVSQYQITDDFM
jgi:hypothetical protein